MLSKVPQLSYIHSIAVSEVIIRSTKHIFTAFLQGLELTHLSIGVAHFLNCFLSSSSSVTVTLSDELKSLTGSSGSRNKKRRNGGTRTKQPSGEGLGQKKMPKKFRIGAQLFTSLEADLRSLSRHKWRFCI